MFLLTTAPWRQQLQRLAHHRAADTIGFLQRAFGRQNVRVVELARQNQPHQILGDLLRERAAAPCHRRSSSRYRHMLGSVE